MKQSNDDVSHAIEQKRQELNHVATLYSIIDTRVITLSQELDLLINTYYKLNMAKKINI